MGLLFIEWGLSFQIYRQVYAKHLQQAIMLKEKNQMMRYRNIKSNKHKHTQDCQHNLTRLWKPETTTKQFNFNEEHSWVLYYILSLLLYPPMSVYPHHPQHHLFAYHHPANPPAKGTHNKSYNWYSTTSPKMTRCIGISLHFNIGGWSEIWFMQIAGTGEEK